MKKKILTIISIITLCIFITGCGKNYKFKNTNTIVQYTNGGLPLEWRYEIKDTSIVDLEDNETINKKPNLDGGRVEKRYYFKGLKKGKTKIIFKYVNVIDDKVEEKKTYIVEVDEDLNIKIAEKK